MKNNFKDRIEEALRPHHKQFTNKAVKRFLRKTTSIRNGMVARCKKQNSVCEITLDEVRDLILKAYGKPCKYCGKKILLSNLNCDHIVPMSAGGATNANNLAAICHSCNRVKGALPEKDFIELLDWLKDKPDNFRNDILRRLSGWKGWR